MSAQHQPRGFIFVRLLRRLMLTALLGASVGVGLRHHAQVLDTARTWLTRLQALVPVGAQSASTVAVDGAYLRLRDDSLVGLYDAVQLFAAAAQEADHDVSARAGQADAQVALARAYSASAALMDAYAKTLRNAERRAADRLVRAERKEAQAHLKEGQQFAKEALRLAPTAFAAHRAMAGALVQGGRLERARPYLAQASAARPEDVSVRLIQAEQVAGKDSSQAVTALEGVLAADPGHHGARFRLALLRWSRGERPQARQEALTLLAGNPAHALAQRLLMELEPLAGTGPQMSRLMPLPRAAEVAPLLAAVPPPMPGAAPGSALMPSRATTVAWLARGAQWGGRGLQWGLRQGLVLAGYGQLGAQALWATAKEQMWGREGTAESAGPAPLRGASAADPQATYGSWVTKARGHEQRRARAEAEGAWQEALKLQPGSCEALVALGWCRLQAHDVAQATSFFARAAQAAPKSAEAQFGLAEAKRMGHDAAGAKAGYSRYLELEPQGPLSPLCHRMLEELGHEG